MSYSSGLFHGEDGAYHYATWMMWVHMTQLWLLLEQYLHTKEPFKVSLLCVCWQAVLDCATFCGHLFVAFSAESLSCSFLFLSCSSLLMIVHLELKYICFLQKARPRDPLRESRGRRSPSLRSTEIVLFLEAGKNFLRGLLLLLLVTSKVAGSTGCFYLMVVAVHSFWLPQIFWNIQTDTSMPLYADFVFGMSATRLVTSLYILRRGTSSDLSNDPLFDRWLCTLSLCSWVALQMIFLFVQSWCGARWMVPKWWLPPKYNYNRLLPSKLLTSDVLVAPPGKIDIATNCRVDNALLRDRYECIICYEPVDIQQQGLYMLTPCNHLYHDSCLQQWMKRKMECPTCRGALPPL